MTLNNVFEYYEHIVEMHSCIPLKPHPPEQIQLIDQYRTKVIFCVKFMYSNYYTLIDAFLYCKMYVYRSGCINPSSLFLAILMTMHNFY